MSVGNYLNSDNSTRMQRLWTKGLIVSLKIDEYRTLADMLDGGVTMTTRDLLQITLPLMRCLFNLHKCERAHGNLKDKYIFVHPLKTGKVGLSLCLSLSLSVSLSLLSGFFG